VQGSLRRCSGQALRRRMPSLREGIPSLGLTTLMDEVPFIPKARTGVSAHTTAAPEGAFLGQIGRHG